MQRVEKALSRHQLDLLSLPNVVGVGKGFKSVRGQTTKKPALIILVEKKLPASRLERGARVPQVLDEAETDVLEVGELRLLARTDYRRPAQPGMSIGHYKITAGTFGAVVKDRQTGEPLILSNNHVLANISNGSDGRASVGDPILQPGPYDGGTNEQVIGYLERFVPINPVVQEVTCGKALRFERALNRLVHLVRPYYQVRMQKITAAANIVDCAVARPVKKDAITPEILELGPVRGVREPQLGMEIVKSGRSSGVTRSTIKVLQATVKVVLDEGLTGLFSDQFVTGPIAQPGDSGSLILDKENYAVGLLFAGSDQTTVGNYIQNVLDKLDVEF
ncbi:hypothetical protein [Neomoorella thermoacetica]|uniref:Uncharacterized protein n=3 Tax=Neomoorella thermoacetica TaxID=1525 RepID=A0A1D7X701_NEOTH|nr:hypothetical protein [Moorella thermoacetica]AKX93028.1 hypothetical protein MOTHE_c02110 [Moorella thermoacetica]AKX95580.1 hypothetical protein MOTHA_c02100 [Moorella thermoacetica]AOQ22696.1 hypothetical protein Maut_00213 [Moorella thermoacetica]OIQ08124.1 hypothetical protein MOOR_23000 [Moorella thermoacetica]OIQ10742.1 hypothetical protein MOOTH_23810 [Moorella thermoacetica]